MNANFDPYWLWLSIPVSQQPPNHYRLLGLELFESDDEVISSAADRQIAHVSSFQSGEYAELSRKILNELAVARITLLNKEKKAKYDAKLRSEQKISFRAKTPNMVEIPPFVPPTARDPKDARRKKDSPTPKSPTQKSERPLKVKEPSKIFSNSRYAVVLFSVLIIALFAVVGFFIIGGNKSNNPNQTQVSDNETKSNKSQPNNEKAMALYSQAFAIFEEVYAGGSNIEKVLEEIEKYEEIKVKHLNNAEDIEEGFVIPDKEYLLPLSDIYSLAFSKINAACELEPDCEDYKKLKTAMERQRSIPLGLQWIANHQLPDGSWNFNHQLAPLCRGACKNPGTLDKAINAATGLALLPFLRLGVTHKEGRFKDCVYRGISYLCQNGKSVRDCNGCSFLEDGGTIYSHGIATICLCEAYGMTKDKRILPAAQGAINYICYHQNSTGGGWRYEPHQAGDMSATGWQMLALTSGYYSGLAVPNQTVSKAEKFLDSVQTDSGAKYGYTEPGAGNATTAIGLLSRMHLGWKPDNPHLRRGVEWLSQIGPSDSDVYYNYYATEVLHLYNGSLWKKWNSLIRDIIFKSQSQQCPEIGSWHYNGAYSLQGGRLYDTALSIMILEIYFDVNNPIYIKYWGSEISQQD